MEEDVNAIKFYDGNGNQIDPNTGKIITASGTGTGSSSGSGWLGGVVSAIPGVISALFPNGVKGNSNSYPTISTLPNGNTNVKLAGDNSNILIIALLGMVAFLLLTGKQPIQSEGKK